jgi:hypothetical protein
LPGPEKRKDTVKYGYFLSLDGGEGEKGIEYHLTLPMLFLAEVS